MGLRFRGVALPAWSAAQGGEGMAALGLAALDFWTSVVVCHTLIVEHGAVEGGAAAGAPAFQARPVPSQHVPHRMWVGVFLP